MKKAAAFANNGGLPVLLGFVLLLTALGLAMSSQPEIPWTIFLIAAGTAQFAGVLGVQMRRIRRLEDLLSADTPEARKSRRRQQLADMDAEAASSPGFQESIMERTSPS